VTPTTHPPQLRQPLAARYGSLASFYAADARRAGSRELDIGLWWRERADGPLHRAAWVSDTGELYLVRLGPLEDGGGEVEVLATVADHVRLERVVEGWREQCGGPRSLTWLRERVRSRGVCSTPLLAQRLAHQIVRADHRELKQVAIDREARTFVERSCSHSSVAP
jgi:hypothetical protein